MTTTIPTAVGTDALIAPNSAAALFEVLRGWGVRHEEIEILEWGSEAMSLKLLAGRCKNSHVAVMVAQLKKQGVIPPS